MARRGGARRLGVFLNSRHVGALEQAASGALSFRYAGDWLAWEMAMPVSLSLPLSPGPYRGQAVVNVFDNLLPDVPGVRDNLAARLRAEGSDVFSLLAVAGRDCVGALQFLPEGEAPGPAGEVRGEALSDADIASLIRALREHPLGNDPDTADFRLSLAGAQDKTALLQTEEGWMRPAGSTATTHILKPPIGIIQNGLDLKDSVQNEYLCLGLCRAFGLPVAEAGILTFEDQTVLGVRRFDRQWREDGRLIRLPQEDFCQALGVPSTRKYQADDGPGIGQIMQRLGESDEPQADRETFFMAQLVFWLLGATDGHAKNFSIALRPGGFRLTPLYDVLSAQPIVDTGKLKRNRFTLAMGVGAGLHRRMDIIQRRHFVQMADQTGLPAPRFEALISQLAERADAALDWLSLETRADDIPQPLADSLAGGISRRLDALRA